MKRRQIQCNAFVMEKITFIDIFTVLVKYFAPAKKSLELQMIAGFTDAWRDV